MLKHLALDQMLWALTGLLPQSNATSVESLWNNNQDFFGFGVITAGLEPYHISIACGFFHLKRLRIRCAIVVSTWQNAIIAALILRFDSTGDAQTGRRASRKT